MKLSERIQIHSGEADPKQSETPIGRDVLDEWADEAEQLETEKERLREAMRHAIYVGSMGGKGMNYLHRALLKGKKPEGVYIIDDKIDDYD